MTPRSLYRFAAVLLLTVAGCTPVAPGASGPTMHAPSSRGLPEAQAGAFPYAAPELVGISTEKLGRLGDYAVSLVSNGDLIGAELFIVKEGRAVFHEVYGWSDREERLPMRRNSIFSIQSMTKSYTATAILILADEGRLRLGDPVRRYIPSFPDDRTTLRHLLSHTSGFGNGQTRLYGTQSSYPSLRAWADTLVTEEPAWPLGTHSYTDLNYFLLGAIVEEVTGARLETFIEERILRPLGMRGTHTAYDPDNTWAQRVPSVYRWYDFAGGFRRVWNRRQPWRWYFFQGAGGLYSTAQDQAVFTAMWMNGGEWNGVRILSEEIVEEALRVHGSIVGDDDGYGYGWRVRPASMSEGLPGALHHSGIDGTLSLGLPREDAVVVVLTQGGDGEAVTSIINRLAMLEIFEGPGPYAPGLLRTGGQDLAEVALSPDERDRYVGFYRAWDESEQQPAEVTRVWEDRGRLRIRIREAGRVTGVERHLVPLGDDVFAMGRYRGDRLESVDPASRILFSVEDGTVTGLRQANGRLEYSVRTDSLEVLRLIEHEQSRLAIDDVVLDMLEEEGIESARRLARSLHAERPDSIRYHPRLLNFLGHRLLLEDRVEDAIGVFEMNGEEYPEIPNVWDSLGDALSEAGRLDDAVRSYERAVELAERAGSPGLEEFRAKLERTRRALRGN